MYELVKNNDLMKSLLISILLPALSILLGEPSFNTNDDVAMMMFSSGWYLSGQPSEYIIFSHIYIGILLKYLYSNFGGVPWYGLYLYFLQTVSVFFICYTFFKFYKGENSIKLLYFLVIFVYGTYFYLYIQFTHVAICLAIAGGLSYVCFLHNRCLGWILAVVVFFILSSLVRFSAVYIVIFLLIPYFIFYLCNVRPKAIITIFSPIIVTILFMSLLSNINSNYYKSDTIWGDYIEYNSVRGGLHANNQFMRFAENISSKELDKVGWSSNDLLMFKEWFFGDPEIYSLDKLNIISNNLSSLDYVFFDFGRFVNILRSYSEYIFLTIFLTVILIYEKSNKIYNIQLIFFLAYFFLLISIMGLLIRIPTRVGVPAFFAFNLFIIFLFFGFPKVDVDKKVKEFADAYKKLFYAVSCFFMIYHLFIIVNITIDNNRNRKNEMLKYAELENLGDEALIVNWGGSSINSEHIDPFSSIEDMPEINYLGLGWSTFSPYYISVLDKYDIDDLYLAIFQDKNVYLVANQSYIKYLLIYMQEHYPDINFKPLTQIESDQNIAIFTNTLNE